VNDFEVLSERGNSLISLLFYFVLVDWGGCGGSLIHEDIALTAAHVSAEGCISSLREDNCVCGVPYTMPFCPGV
jgi:hypothetical protein